MSRHLLFTLYVMNVWIHHDRFEIHHSNPAWFIPVVGSVLVLFTIIIFRVMFHHPLAAITIAA